MQTAQIDGSMLMPDCMRLYLVSYKCIAAQCVPAKCPEIAGSCVASSVWAASDSSCRKYIQRAAMRQALSACCMLRKLDAEVLQAS